MLRATKRACGGIDNVFNYIVYNLSTYNLELSFKIFYMILKREKPNKIMIQRHTPYNGYNYQ